MNTIPITLTIYYPTMAQVEAYAGFMAMVTIGFCVIRLATGFRSSDGTVFIFEMMLLFNPIGACLPLIVDRFLRNGIDNWLYLFMYAVTPFLLVVPFLL